MDTLKDSLADYIVVLSRSIQTTADVIDRDNYIKHLAEAAKIFSCLHSGRMSEARELVIDQRRIYGWGRLSGDEGRATTTAFEKFASMAVPSHDDRHMTIGLSQVAQPGSQGEV